MAKGLLTILTLASFITLSASAQRKTMQIEPDDTVTVYAASYCNDFWDEIIPLRKHRALTPAERDSLNLYFQRKR